ncbi:MAG: RND family transporter, partial [Haliea sp.]|nr:RND family transporter [Haliea sp.]
AVQVNLLRDTRYFDLLQQRDALRAQAADGALSSADQQTLSEVELAFKAHTAQSLEAQAQLVASVREIADDYRQYADIFVGGVPMITAD